MTRSVVVLVAILVTACRAEVHGPKEQEQEDVLRRLGPGVHAQIVQGGVRVLNATNTDIRFVVVNPHWLGLLAPCNEFPSQCSHLRPNADEVVPPSRIHGIEDNPSVLVVRYWRPGDEHSTEISISRSSGP